MFTGIIQSVGRVLRKQRRGPGARLELSVDFAELELGESIAVDGACLTVAEHSPHSFVADTSQETLQATTLGALEVGASVNLERALSVGDRLGGHFVSGHVDGVAEVVQVVQVGDSRRLSVRAPTQLMRFIAPKGSVCLAGASLTVNRVQGSVFELMLVPHTLSCTTLTNWRPGSRLNLEVDVLARYVQRALEVGTP